MRDANQAPALDPQLAYRRAVAELHAFGDAKSGEILRELAGVARFIAGRKRRAGDLHLALL